MGNLQQMNFLNFLIVFFRYFQLNPTAFGRKLKAFFFVLPKLALHLAHKSPQKIGSKQKKTAVFLVSNARYGKWTSYDEKNGLVIEVCCFGTLRFV